MDSVMGVDCWDALRRREPDRGMDKQLEEWLQSDSPLSLNTSSIWLIDKALVYVLKKILYLAGITVQGVLITGLTLIDRLAIALERAINFSKEVGEYVKQLLNRILRALGWLQWTHQE